MTQTEFEKILQQHTIWLADKTKGQRADFSNKNLSKFDFKKIDLSCANFEGTNLSGTNFYYTKLIGANFKYANLMFANLMFANLIDANFNYANLNSVKFINANLTNANLKYTNLRNVLFNRANLTNANLKEANCTKAIMHTTTLINTQYENTILNLQCPEEGAFVGFKKCRNNVIIKLLITEDALRSSATTRKCRASKVKVLEIFNANEAISTYDENFIYHVGDIKEISNFDKKRWNNCSTGIHFFITKQEAENYQIICL